MKNTDYITINKGHKEDVFFLSSKNVFFDTHERCVIKIHEDKITIRGAILDDVVSTKITKNKLTKWFSIWFRLDDFNLTGKYLIDKEESNEDEIVVYFEDKL